MIYSFTENTEKRISKIYHGETEIKKVYHGSTLVWEEPTLPTEIAGLQLWLESKDVSTITLTSGLISTWTDKSGLSNNATQTTAVSRPAYTDNIVTFDGSNDFLLINSIQSHFESANYVKTLFFRIDPNSFGVNNDFFTILNTDNTSSFLVRLNVSNTLRVLQINSGSVVADVTTGALNTSTNITVGIRFNGSTIDIFQNGSTLISGASFSPTATAFDTVNLGKSQFRGYPGKVHSMLLYDGALINENIVKMSDYLNY